jgi:hypothetical protein
MTLGLKKTATNKYKIPVKTQKFYFVTATPGLHVSNPLSHHQALQVTDPRMKLVNVWDPGVYENLDNSLYYVLCMYVYVLDKHIGMTNIKKLKNCYPEIKGFNS